MTDGWYFASLLGWALAWMALVRPLRLGQALLCAVCGMLLTAYLGVIVLPLLVLVGDVIGIFGGYIVAVYQLDFNPANYINATVNELQPIDVYTGVIKAAVFGFVIALMGCYNGYKSKGGAQGVGEATTNAVVASSIIILIFNYIITGLIFTK